MSKSNDIHNFRQTFKNRYANSIVADLKNTAHQIMIQMANVIQISKHAWMQVAACNFPAWHALHYRILAWMGFRDDGRTQSTHRPCINTGYNASCFVRPAGGTLNVF